MTITSVTVTMAPKLPDGSSARGRYVFTLSAPITDGAGLRVLALPRLAVLNAAGTAQIVLYATDDATTAPAGQTYLVDEWLSDASGTQPEVHTSWSIALPHAVSPVALETLAPVTPGPQTFSYALASGLTAETARATAAEALRATTVALTAETARATGAEALAATAAALTTETTRATGAEGSEVTRATGAEALKATIVALTAETARATTAEALKVPLTTTQASELTLTPVFAVVPTTVGAPQWRVIENSFANTAGGAGTYNHAVFAGWNADLHAGGAGVAGQPAIGMGFEDNFYDPADSTYGVEWYVEYWSPDHTTVQMMRPFYARVRNSNLNSANNATIHMDIGTDGTGVLAVYKGLASPALFTITPTLVQFTLSLLVTGNNFQLAPPAGQGLFTINSANPTLLFENAGTPSWYVASYGVNNFTISDKNVRAHIVLTQGASATAAVTALSSTLTVAGNVGFYGHAAVAQPAAPVTLADVIAVIRGCGLSA